MFDDERAVQFELNRYGNECGADLEEVPVPGPKGYTHGWVRHGPGVSVNPGDVVQLKDGKVGKVAGRSGESIGVLYSGANDVESRSVREVHRVLPVAPTRQTDAEHEAANAAMLSRLRRCKSVQPPPESVPKRQPRGPRDDGRPAPTSTGHKIEAALRQKDANARTATDTEAAEHPNLGVQVATDGVLTINHYGEGQFASNHRPMDHNGKPTNKSTWSILLVNGGRLINTNPIHLAQAQDIWSRRAGVTELVDRYKHSSKSVRLSLDKSPEESWVVRDVDRNKVLGSIPA